FEEDPEEDPEAEAEDDVPPPATPPVGSSITPLPLFESSSDIEDVASVIKNEALEMPPIDSTYEAWVSERLGRGALDARPDVGNDRPVSFGESKPPKPPGSPSSSQIMPPKMMKRKAVNKMVKKQIAEAIKEYKRTRVDLGNASGSREANTSGPVTVQGCTHKTFMNGKPHPFNETEGVVGVRRWIEKVEQVFEICKCAEEDKVMFAASTFKDGGRALDVDLKGDDIEAYNNCFHELALMCPDLVPNEKKKIESDSPLLGVNTPISDEDRLELMKLMVFLLPKVEKVGIGVNAIDLQVFAVRHMLLMLQALVDKRKVVVIEATIREALHLDNAKGVDYLPNEEIFSELARMGYEKPSTKLTFYKAFFSSQWKFLIHIILQCMSAKRTYCNEFSSSMASAVICLSSGKGFSRVETPLFEGMLVEQKVDEEGDVDENVEEVNVGDADEEDVSAAHGEVSTVTEEPSIPSPTPPTPPQQPPQDIHSTSQLKRRVKKLEKRNKVRVLKLRRLQKVGTSQRVETSDDTVMDDESNQGRMIAKIDQDDVVVLRDDKEEDREVADVVKDVKEAKEDETEPAEVQKVVDVVTTAKLITDVVNAPSETVIAATAIITTAEAQVPAATLTVAPARVTAALSRRRKGVVIRDPEEESTTSTIIPAETKSKDKGKGILDEAIDHVKRKAKEDHAVKRYQVLKRKPQTEAQARKNMVMYLKNVDGFKMDYFKGFKGMSYDDIRPIFEAKFNSNVAFLLKTKEQIEEDENKVLQKLNETPAERATKRRKLDEEVEELKRHLQIVPNEDDDVYTDATPLARKVPVVDYQIIEMNNKPYYKIIRADDTHQLFSTTKPKNFFDDFLLVTLGAMFKKPDIHAQIWKNQRTIHGPAKVKGWKLLESCGVQIITFTSTQLILLVESKYLLTRFTLDQMLNSVRLEVEEESEVSLELLRFTRQQHQEGQLE
nr:hypothetical protein [Tanacetum cinerariifolium]